MSNLGMFPDGLSSFWWGIPVPVSFRVSWPLAKITERDLPVMLCPAQVVPSYYHRIMWTISVRVESITTTSDFRR